MMGKGSKAWYEIYESRICEIEEEGDLGIPEKYRMGASSSHGVLMKTFLQIRLENIRHQNLT